MRRIGLAALALALTASAASAQSAGDESYVQGFGGLSFGPAKTAGVFGAEVGVPVADNLQVYGTLGRFTNIATNALQDSLDDDFEPACEFEFGADCEAEATLRATFITAGVKYLFPTSGAIRPYVAGGVGFMFSKLKIEEIDFGDITDELIEDDSDTSGLFEIGGGVDIPVGTNMKIDAGYKLMKIFEDESDLVSRVYAGFGVKF